MDVKTYEDGLAEGRIRGIEETVAHHEVKLEEHEQRLRNHDRLQWGVIGAIGLMQVIPLLDALLSR